MKPFDESLLSAYLDDVLTDEERQWVEQQLAARPELVAELESLRGLRARLGSLAVSAEGMDLTARVMQSIQAPPAIHASPASIVKTSLGETPWLGRRSTWGVLAAAACLVMLASFVQWENGRVREVAMQSMPTDAPATPAPSSAFRGPTRSYEESDPAQSPPSDTLGLEKRSRPDLELSSQLKSGMQQDLLPGQSSLGRDGSQNPAIADPQDRLAKMDEWEAVQTESLQRHAQESKIATKPQPALKAESDANAVDATPSAPPDHRGLQDPIAATSRFQDFNSGVMGGMGSMSGGGGRVTGGGGGDATVVAPPNAAGNAGATESAKADGKTKRGKVALDDVEAESAGEVSENMDSLNLGGKVDPQALDAGRGGISAPRMSMGRPDSARPRGTMESTRLPPGSVWFFNEGTQFFGNTIDHSVPPIPGERMSDAVLQRPLTSEDWQRFSLISPYPDPSFFFRKENGVDNKPDSVPGFLSGRLVEEQGSPAAQAWVLATPAQWNTFRDRLLQQGLIASPVGEETLREQSLREEGGSDPVSFGRPPRLIVPQPYGEVPCRWYKLSW